MKSPRTAWQPITCWACGDLIQQGQLVQWSGEFWGHPDCVTAFDATGVKPAPEETKLSKRQERRDRQPRGRS
jgi:hypothetical protein